MHDANVQVHVGNSVVQTLLQSMDAIVSIAAVCTDQEVWEDDVAIPGVVDQSAGHVPSQEVVIFAHVAVLEFEEIEQYIFGI